MTTTEPQQPPYSDPIAPGLVILSASASLAQSAQDAVYAELATLGLAYAVQSSATEPTSSAAGFTIFKVRFCLTPAQFTAWTPGFDTLGLCQRLGLKARSDAQDLAREIWIAMLASPIALEFPSADEVISSVRIRQFMVNAARKTSMDFQTSEAKRPADCWVYHEDKGFTVVPGHSLVDALTRATQPEQSGALYSFSCYRATEYVILLGIAQEAQFSNPALLAGLQSQWEQRAVMSGKFHDVFLREYGTQDAPLPITAYIPGDRVWFRNPDDTSSDVAGYEGSWVFYLGSGEFPNFWQHDKPFTLQTKCVEVYHWRHGVYRDAEGELQIDEAIVERRVQETLGNPQALAQVFERMFRLRDPKGIYAEGGCMDTTRESPRWVRPSTTDITLPGWY